MQETFKSTKKRSYVRLTMTTYKNILYNGKFQDFTYTKNMGELRLFTSNLGHTLSQETLDGLVEKQKQGNEALVELIKTLNSEGKC